MTICDLRLVIESHPASPQPPIMNRQDFRLGPDALKLIAECLKSLIAHPDTSGYAPREINSRLGFHPANSAARNSRKPKCLRHWGCSRIFPPPIATGTWSACQRRIRRLCCVHAKKLVPANSDRAAEAAAPPLRETPHPTAGCVRFGSARADNCRQRRRLDGDL